ncbi:SufE family protein [Pseudomonas sp. 21LCFQ02]|uniref:SufE family protein n=1 Tax=unclassified Pseudomonas TaxID=196821 RepID=UPI0004F6B4C3|nr:MULTISPECIES: SufE family protein [unclassified Pseudomonas]MCO8166333.1 SufE family protein [Pseudomonas sp. 21LCFQ02]MCQ9422648.1 SufE family protein [Pseudomonas sp. LJDD11]BAP43845.1 sufE protein [Pseudomonas sp. StFLB209]
MTLGSEAVAAQQAFSQLQGWEQRARLLMQWGERLSALSEAEKSEQHRVHGCESQVWLLADAAEGRWQFRASSDARLLRGLLALLLVRVNGLSAEQLRQVDVAQWFDSLGLGRQLSPSRSNGLNAVLQRMRELAAQS